MSTTSTPFSGQFGRYAQLVVSKGGQGLDLSNLRFRFDVKASDVDTPNTLVARVYNLAEDTVNSIVQEYDTVTLTAGFQNGNKANIFQGDIKQFYFGKERNVDSFLEIRAGDGDRAYNNAIMNQTFPAGTTDQQTLSAIAAEMGLPVTQTANGYLTLGGILPRGKTQFGMARIHMRELADKNNCRWSIQNGVITLVPNTGYLPGTAVEINSATGMIGTPEQTDNGIIVRCLLNPLISIGQAVKINNRDINRARLIGPLPNAGFPSYTSQYYPATIANDGLYRVIVAEHSGDTRGHGDDFYTELICLDVDPSSAPSQSVLANG
jgi:hypothetical protein